MKWKGHHDMGLDGVTRVAYFTAQFRNFHGKPEDKHEKFTMIVEHWPEFELCAPLLPPKYKYICLLAPVSTL
jgi:hypothetical protein